MIAFIKAPIQGASLLCRKLCVHASVSTHQNISALQVNGPSFHVLNESIYVLNERIIDTNDGLYDAKGKSVTDVPASLSSLTKANDVNKACAHDVQYVIKGVFYVPNCVSMPIKASFYVPNYVSMPIKVSFYARNHTYKLYKEAQNEMKTTYKAIKIAFNVIKRVSKSVKVTLYAHKLSFHVLKDVYYVIKDVSYVIKGNVNEAKEITMMSMIGAPKGFGTCKGAIMRGSLDT